MLNKGHLQILPKMVAMALSLKESKKRSGSRKFMQYLSFGEKIVKIGPVDPKIICLKLKKEEITESKIYSPVGRFAMRAKNVQR